MPIFEWDPRKSERNRERHGVSLEDAEALWFRTHAVILARSVKGEPRFAILGRLEGRLYVVIFTERLDRIRLISFHKADRRWERLYETFVEKKGTA